VTYEFNGISPDQAPGYADRALSVLIDCSEVGEAGDLLVLVNMDDQDLTYTLPKTGPQRPWQLIIDTAEAHEEHANHWLEGQGPTVDGTYEVCAWSVVVLGNPGQ